MSSSTSGSSSESEQASSSSPPPHKRQRLSEQEIGDDSEDESSSDDSSDAESETSRGDADNDDTPVLSHAEKRRQKKKEKRGEIKDTETTGDSTDKKGKAKVKNTAELAPSKVPKRQNSVWVGNLSFKTTPEALKAFFDGVGEITRIHMPMKMTTGGPGDRPRQENRGFAYVDFATPDAKAVAITLSERPLDGRRLLIKDGDDFNGRPTATTTTGADGAEPGAPKATGLTKTAQKILRVQKQPAGPTLFFGNLGFETTEESIRELLDSHRPKTVDEKWIRKVRMGTFEDSGKCKGWAFVDFTNTEHATAALTNPRNHTLNGRKLVVEYASPEAVRRGGGGPPRADKGHGGQKGERRPMKREREAARADDAAEGEQRPSKKRHAEDGNEAQSKGGRGKSADAAGKGGKNPRARARPGAALAQAKREDVAIVPSQGKKIVFS
ncbi:hypothetical protein BN946_scf184908.g109 [Trametes cinnabarina]|uniref:RRM domain-containing protein n=1 Tax=Pycnoporus cinnabarinus TaxID=5643 RepID=A0A060SAX4_PYCCI|nr:hypothetical protein BN946_scf184908.g109 [Trametes cinnabarina]